MSKTIQIIAYVWLLFCCTVRTNAQAIKLSVELDGEPAEYAFVFVNDRYVGNCDSSGVFLFKEGTVNPGDTLYASMAGLKSEAWLFSNTREVLLKIQAGPLAFSKVEGGALNTWDEYMKLVKRMFVELRPSHRYVCEYDITWRTFDGKDLRDMKGSESLALLLKPVFANGAPVYYVSLLDGVDGEITERCGADIYNSSIFLSRAVNNKRLKRQRQEGSILIHRLQEGDHPCFLLIDRQRETNHTLVKFSKDGQEIVEIIREYSGDLGVRHYLMDIVPNTESPGRIFPLCVTIEFIPNDGHIIKRSTLKNIRSSLMSKEEKRIFKMRLESLGTPEAIEAL